MSLQMRSFEFRENLVTGSPVGVQTHEEGFWAKVRSMC
jgi:hypothetical protein